MRTPGSIAGWWSFRLEVTPELWRNYGTSHEKKTEVEVLPVVDLSGKSGFQTFFLGRCNAGEKANTTHSNQSTEPPGMHAMNPSQTLRKKATKQDDNYTTPHRLYQAGRAGILGKYPFRYRITPRGGARHACRTALVLLLRAFKHNRACNICCLYSRAQKGSTSTSTCIY